MNKDRAPLIRLAAGPLRLLLLLLGLLRRRCCCLLPRRCYCCLLLLLCGADPTQSLPNSQYGASPHIRPPPPKP
jgi:hypothetical protein